MIAYTINGFGGSLQDAQANGFVANYKDNAAAKMGILHAAYGKEYPRSILVGDLNLTYLTDFLSS